MEDEPPENEGSSEIPPHRHSLEDIDPHMHPDADRLLEQHTEQIGKLAETVEEGYQPPKEIKVEGKGHRVYVARAVMAEHPRWPYVLGTAALLGAAALFAFRPGSHKTTNWFPQYTTEVVAEQQTPYAMPSQMTPIVAAQSDLECVVTRTQLREAVKDKQKLDSLAEVFANAYSGVAPPFATSTQQLSLDNAKRYLIQLTDGKRSAANKLKGTSANPESVSTRLSYENGLYVIKVDFEETNSAGQIVSKTGDAGQSFYLVPETASTYAPQFCKAFENLK